MELIKVPYIFTLLAALLIGNVAVSASEMLTLPLVESSGTRRQLQRTCGSTNVTTCRVQASRDILFLVDASDSMEPSAFYGAMLDYVQDLWWYALDM